MSLSTHALILGTALAIAPACAAPSASTSHVTGHHAATQSGPCEESRYRSDQEVVCETRTLIIDHRDLVLDASANGGVEVEAWDRNQIEIVASVKAVAPTEAEARRLVDETRIETNGVVRAIYPEAMNRQRSDRRSVSVSYKVRVPRATNLDLKSVNGGIGVAGVSGELRLHTVNGGVSMTGVSGDVTARTTNGGITASLAGSEWEGRGLDVQTTNGGVTLAVPTDYSADLSASTQNGGISLDGVSHRNGNVQRERNRNRYEGALGRGGAPIRAETSNGGIRIRRR